MKTRIGLLIMALCVTTTMAFADDTTNKNPADVTKGQADVTTEQKDKPAKPDTHHKDHKDKTAPKKEDCNHPGCVVNM